MTQSLPEICGLHSKPRDIDADGDNAMAYSFYFLTLLVSLYKKLISAIR